MVVYERIPVKIKSGEQIGVGTVSVYAPAEIQQGQTVTVELDLDFDEIYVTPTPYGARTVFPVTRPSPLMVNARSPTPRVPVVQATGVGAYMRMGATLDCSGNFDGCDTKSQSPEPQFVRVNGAKWL